MKVIKIIAWSVVVILGIGIVVFGEYDDSPGAQGIGVLLALFALFRLWKNAK